MRPLRSDRALGGSKTHQHRPPSRLAKDGGAEDRLSLDHAANGLAINDVVWRASVWHYELLLNETTLDYLVIQLRNPAAPRLKTAPLF
jgi:hypothetical protein